MKNSEELRRILTEDLGFVDLDAYRKWIAEVRPTITPTPERIAKLSPDDIDCSAFWKVCEDLFGIDPVFNVVATPEVGNLPYAVETQMDANRMNLRFAKSLGITAFLDEFAHQRVKTLEIGPGYGSIKNYIETRTEHIYTGIDVYPRIPGVIPTTPQGLIPAEMLERERDAYSSVIASNVFQHLSAKQRSRYFQDAHQLLHKGGVFIFNLTVNTGKMAPHVVDKSGNAWTDHYGQYTLMPKPGDLQKEVTSLFFVMYLTQRYDGLFNFVCQKRQ